MTTHIVPIVEQASATLFETAHIQPVAPNAAAEFSPASLDGASTSVRGPSVRLSVPLDSKQTVTTTRKILRRDSLDRREALLKGKEGSRQRRRWENGEFQCSYLHLLLSG